jgi:maleylacetate reductase
VLQSATRRIRRRLTSAPPTPAFVHDNLPGRVVFGAGATEEHLLPELDRLQVRSVLTITSHSQIGRAERIAAALAKRNMGVLDLGHGPSRPDLTAAVAKDVCGTPGSGLLVIGGGSAICRAKTAAVGAQVPLVAIPTTYSGAELSPSYESNDGARRSYSPQALPSAVIYDPQLTFTLTPELAGSSAMSALANGVEALCCTSGSPVSALIAEKGIRHIAEGTRDSALHPDSLLGRSLTQFGAYLTGASAAVTTPGLPQTLSEAMVAVCGVSYADARAVIVTHYLAAQRNARPLALAAIAAALGRNDAVDGLHEFAEDVGAPRCLADVGMTAKQIGAVIEHCRKRTRNHVHAVVDKALSDILHAALVRP